MATQRFMNACRQGQRTTVLNHLEAGNDVNEYDFDGKTGLHHACMGKQVQMVRLLKEWKADLRAFTKPTVPGMDAYTGLHLACQQGTPEGLAIMVDLMASGCSLLEPTARGLQCTHLAVLKKRLDVLEWMHFNHRVPLGESTHTYSRVGRVGDPSSCAVTPVLLALIKESPQCLQALVKWEVDLQCSDANGWTLVHWACVKNNTRALALLASAPLFPPLREMLYLSVSTTPRVTAPPSLASAAAAPAAAPTAATPALAVPALPNRRYSRRQSVAEELLGRIIGWSPLHIAASLRSLDCINVLTAKPWRLSPSQCQLDEKWSPAHTAALYGYHEILCALKDAGADLHARTAEVVTLPLPLGLAMTANPSVLKGGDTTTLATYPAESTPAHIAANHGRVMCLLRLEAWGCADEDAEDDDGGTYVDCLEEGQLESLEKLRASSLRKNDKTGGDNGDDEH